MPAKQIQINQKPLQKALVLRRDVGYVLFNCLGKAIAMNPQPGPIFRIANRDRIKIVNENSVDGLAIQSMIRH